MGPTGLGRVRARRALHPDDHRALHRVGVMLATGALIGVFIVPSVTRAFGFGPGYVIAYDVSGLALGAVGLALMLLANVLAHASALQHELDEIF
ncbi:DUF2975 domain-containing protein [Hyalangium rubrum]|uniref:DUF2975 domain-containing protein n=1 Tax=Hyalangium rubrum TaxID=3103134 RepID=A0ABU5H2M4_9BACT|nr:DUF2975 domain-containing protein [Hyalangium sp. s54d21]MDY7227144.1 DUF2975 domain-containing protein [Hyalangium sp. s54d21]